MNRQNMAHAEYAKMSVFAVKKQYRALTSRDPLTLLVKKRRLSFSDLVRCACFPESRTSQNVMSEIAISPGLLLQYEWILQKMSIGFVEAQVAASSDKLITSRNTEQFRLEIKPDSSNNEQAYLLLTLNPTLSQSSVKENGLFLHCILNEEFRVVRFKHIIDGQAQIVVEKNSDLYNILSDVNTKIYLC